MFTRIDEVFNDPASHDAQTQESETEVRGLDVFVEKDFRGRRDVEGRRGRSFRGRPVEERGHRGRRGTFLAAIINYFMVLVLNIIKRSSQS